MNSVNIVGYVTKNLELRYTQSGKAVVDMPIAINETYKGSSTAHFFTVVCWGKIAESCASYLFKGSRVSVSGKLNQHRWEKDGQKRSKVVIVAKNVLFISGRETRPVEDEHPEIENL